MSSGKVRQFSALGWFVPVLLIFCAIATGGQTANAHTATRIRKADHAATLIARPAKPRPSLRQRMKAKVARLKESRVGQFAAGLLVDGPVETWKAIRKNPKTFAVGLCLTAACALAGDLAGISAHALIVGASGTAAAAQVAQVYKNEYRDAEAGRSRIAGKMAWLPALVVATAIAGGAIAAEHHAGPMSVADISRSLSSGVVTGGDLPTASVTAYQDWLEHRRQPAPTQ